MRTLSQLHLERLVTERVYTTDEVAALMDPTTECSWRAESERMAGPLPTMAVSAGRVVGGVYLWQNRRDVYWFLEVLIRDPADRFLSWDQQESFKIATSRLSSVARETWKVNARSHRAMLLRQRPVPRQRVRLSRGICGSTGRKP
jgi:hypothetical protein